MDGHRENILSIPLQHKVTSSIRQHLIACYTYLCQLHAKCPVIPDSDGMIFAAGHLMVHSSFIQSLTTPHNSPPRVSCGTHQAPQCCHCEMDTAGWKICSAFENSLPSSSWKKNTKADQMKGQQEDLPWDLSRET